ncbi:hypothetical protein SSX86_024808 [Deinandra increscens subsp. villosa]|uniref:Reverse transcriptase zinc-binding domain-containing protein n=1 Tax=Deinandra increscens subsp. villosa TaxID=3103831 RepID=A0AAP0CBC8_9ASTR
MISAENTPAKSHGNGVWNGICQNAGDLHARNIIPATSFKRTVGSGSSVSFWNDTWIGDSSLASSFPRLFSLENFKECKVSDRIIGNIRAWSWRRPLRGGGGIEESQWNRLVAVLNGFMCNGNGDSWGWDLEGNNEFVVNHVRKVIERATLLGNNTKTTWNKAVPKKINIMIWRLLNDRLPVRAKLLEKGIIFNNFDCVFCDNHLETAPHLFGSCPLVRATWIKVQNWLGIDGRCDVSPESIFQWIDNSSFNKRRKTLINGCLFVCFAPSCC